jgi:RHS repeat-associated protein
MTDPNGNRTQVGVDALGRVIWTAALGSVAAPSGDTPADPTARIEYDHDAWVARGEPASAHTFARERHGPTNPRWQEQYTYTGGLGGVVLAKVQAEPGKAWRRNPGTGAIEEVDTTPNLRWVGNGRTIVNNKGNPVRQFEPYFSTSPGYDREPELVERGKSPTLYYDPVGRLIRTEHPDGTLSRVEVGPWQARAFDRNDTVLDSQWYVDRGSPDPNGAEPANPETRAAWLAAKHANTPSVSHPDSLGRTICSIADNGAGVTYRTRTELDLTGRVSRVFDNRNREVARAETNMLGAACRAKSAERGEHWVLLDVAGAVARIWDDRGRKLRMEPDAARRPQRVFLDGGTGEKLVSFLQYGEEHPDAVGRNLRGKVFRAFNQAGAITFERFDFKGGVAEAHRRLAKQYKGVVDWAALIALPGPIDLPTVTARADALLDAETFRGTITTDALGRPIEGVLPDGTVLRPAFNEANYVERLSAQVMGAGAFIPFLTAAEHDAKGQRLSVALGNGTASTYEYDPDTFRMTRLRTARPADATVLQDIRYIFDPVGNVVSLADAAQAVVFHGGEQVRPERRFEYDAVYQLVRATGRESRAPATQPNHTDLVALSAAHPHDVQAVRNYVEEYEYDDLGNIGRLRHVAAGGSWTRRYQYGYETNPADLTNRLTGTSEPGDPDGVFSSGYTYDPSGGMLTMPHLAGGLAWNVFDQLAEVDLGGGGRAFYVYGAGGQRMRKVIERNGNTKLEWIFLGPVMIFRRRRRDTDQLRFERWTLHLGDGAGHVAQVDIKTRDDDDEDPANAVGAPLIRYQYSNHLGSVMLETDTNGDPVSYEEYHPYGTSAYRAARPGAHLSLKRFRFSGKERDDETGLYYFGARYYAPWLGRWTSADPAGFADGLNLYAFSLNNPATLSDPTGTQSTDSKVKWIVPKSVTTKEKFEQWAKRAGIQYSGEPAYDKGKKIWSAGNWTRVAPGQGGAVHPNPTGTEGEAPAPEGGGGPPLRPAIQPPPAAATQTPPSTPEPAPAPSGASSSGTVAAAAQAVTEGSIWNPTVSGSLSRAEQLAINSRRGFILESLAGNNLGRTFPLADKLTSSGVVQIKSVATESTRYISQVVRNATRDAGKAIAQNIGFAGRAAQAQIIVPTGTSADVVAAAQSALQNVRKPIPGAVAPQVTRGLPGVAGLAGKGLAFVGVPLSGYSFYRNVESGHFADALLGDAPGFASGGLTIGAIFTGSALLAESAAVVGAFGLGYLAGSLLDKGVEWASKKAFGVDLSPSNVLASGMTAVDQALTPLWADPSKPAYTQTLGWKLADWFGL